MWLSTVVEFINRFFLLWLFIILFFSIWLRFFFLIRNIFNHGYLHFFAGLLFRCWFITTDRTFAAFRNEVPSAHGTIFILILLRFWYQITHPSVFGPDTPKPTSESHICFLPTFMRHKDFIINNLYTASRGVDNATMIIKCYCYTDVKICSMTRKKS